MIGQVELATCCAHKHVIKEVSEDFLGSADENT